MLSTEIKEQLRQKMYNLTERKANLIRFFNVQVINNSDEVVENLHQEDYINLKNFYNNIIEDINKQIRETGRILKNE